MSEATDTDVGHLGLERGHRMLTITRKGGKVVIIPLAPCTARAIDLAVGERTDGPVFVGGAGFAAFPWLVWVFVISVIALRQRRPTPAWSASFASVSCSAAVQSDAGTAASRRALRGSRTRFISPAGPGAGLGRIPGDRYRFPC